MYSGTLMGTLKQESVGKMVFVDEKYGFVCEIKFGEVKKKPTDYFTGDVVQNGKVLSKCNGTYLGYIDFDGKRYFDHRYVTPHTVIANFVKGIITYFVFLDFHEIWNRFSSKRSQEET